MRLHELMRQLDAVEQEHHAATAAISHVLRAADRDPTLLQLLEIERRPLRICLSNLERTYMVRLFAVFEENLRDIWASWGKRSRPKAEDLLRGCAARRKVSGDVAAQAHTVRLFRNSVVHGGDADFVTLPEARSVLSRFTAWMPAEW